MFIWTLQDAVTVAVIIFMAIVFSIIWIQDWFAKRRRAKR